ncbi:PIN domain-containing protein, partial [Streptomyces caeruleatus]
LFDTNIISDLINRGRTSRVVEPLREIGAGVCTSLIVVSEVRYGVAKKASASLSERAEAILAILPVCPFEELVDSHYADIRVTLEQSG